METVTGGVLWYTLASRGTVSECVRRGLPARGRQVPDRHARSFFFLSSKTFSSSSSNLSSRKAPLGRRKANRTGKGLAGSETCFAGTLR